MLCPFGMLVPMNHTPQKHILSARKFFLPLIWGQTKLHPYGFSSRNVSLCHHFHDFGDTLPMLIITLPISSALSLYKLLTGAGLGQALQLLTLKDLLLLGPGKGKGATRRGPGSGMRAAPGLRAPPPTDASPSPARDKHHLSLLFSSFPQPDQGESPNPSSFLPKTCAPAEQLVPTSRAEPSTTNGLKSPHCTETSLQKQPYFTPTLLNCPGLLLHFLSHHRGSNEISVAAQRCSHVFPSAAPSVLRAG